MQTNNQKQYVPGQQCLGKIGSLFEGAAKAKATESARARRRQLEAVAEELGADLSDPADLAVCWELAGK